MANNSPTIVAASLSDDQLKKSIDSLVTHVDEAMKKMVQSTNNAVGEMEAKLKSLGNLKIDSGGSADGGASKRAKAQNAETDAIEKNVAARDKQIKKNQEVKMSYDQMQTALEKATRLPSEMRMPDMAKSARESFQAFYKGFNEQARKLDSLIKAEDNRLSSAGLGRFSNETRAQLSQIDVSIDQTRWKMNLLYQEEKRLNQEALRQKVGSAAGEQAWLQKYEARSARIKEGERLIELEKERQRIIASDPSVQQLDRNIEQTRTKIRQLYEEEKRLNEQALKQPVGSGVGARLWNQKYTVRDERIANEERLIQLEKERQSLVAVDPIRTQIANMDELRAKHEKTLGVMRDETTASNKITESQQQQINLTDSQKAKLAELEERYARLKKERQEAHKAYQEAGWERFGAKLASGAYPNDPNIQAKLATAEEKLRIATENLNKVKAEQAQLDKEIETFKKSLNAANIQEASSTQQATQSAQRYTEEIRKQAAAIRATKEWQEKGHVTIGDVNYYDKERANASKRDKQLLLSLEEQIVQAQQQATQSAQRHTEQTEKGSRALQEQKEHLESIKNIASQARKYIGQYGFANITNYRGVVYAENDERAKGLTIEQQIEKIIQEENAARNTQLGTERQITEEVEKRGKKYVSPNAEINTAFNRMVANKIGLSEQDINSTSTKISSLTQYIKQLEQAWSKMTDAERNSPFGKQLRQELQYTTRLVQQARAEIARPINLKDALSGSEKTLDDIAYKMQRLRAYKQGIDLTKPTATNEIKQVDEALAKLQKDADKWMSKSNDMIKSNTALGRSWNYMKNRLAFYFTVGASTQFVKNLIEIRGQYELLERSIGILFDSMQTGTRIFSELNAMAIKSPFTTMELGAAAKQLSAYNIAAKDVVDTTRRLADIAAAVGIPIERLTYALGQIKSYGYLNSRDARMFANAGIPLIQNLADMYTKLEGRLVSIGDVYDRIKKKQISFEDTLKVVNEMTDEGGRFFNFQEKAADTLKVKLANLNLAYNNFLNSLGKQTQGGIAASMKILETMLIHWREIDRIITGSLKVFGTLKAIQLAYLYLLRKQTAELAVQTALGSKMGKIFGGIKGSMKGLAASPFTWITGVIVAIGYWWQRVEDLKEANAELNKTISDGAKENIDSIDKFFKDYEKDLSGIGSASVADQQKLWEKVRDEIEKTSKNAEEYINILEKTEDLTERVSKGAQTLRQEQIIQGEIKNLSDRGLFSLGGEMKDDSWLDYLMTPILDDEFAKDLKKYAEKVNEGRKKEFKTISQMIENGQTWSGVKLRGDLYENAAEARKQYETFKKMDFDKIIGDAVGEEAIARLRSAVKLYKEFFFSQEEAKNVTQEGIDLFDVFFDRMTAAFIQEQNLSHAAYESIINDINITERDAAYGILASVNTDEWNAFINSLDEDTKNAVKEISDDIRGGQEHLRELGEADVFSPLEEDAYRIVDIIKDKFPDAYNQFATKFYMNVIDSVHSNISAWNAFFDNLTDKDRHALEYLIKSNQTGSEEFKKIWDKAAQSLMRSSTTFFSQIEGDIQRLRETPDIVLNIVHKERRESLDKQQKNFVEEFITPEKWTTRGLTMQQYLEEEEANRRKYARFNKKTDEDNVEWEKRLGEEWAKNEKTLKSLNKQLAGRNKLSEADRKQKEKERDDIKETQSVLKEIEKYENFDFSQFLKTKKGEDVLAKLLSKEAQLVKQLQSDYDKLTKAGMTSAGALSVVRKTYSATIREVNKNLGSFGLKGLDLNILQGKDPSKVLKYFTELRDTIQKKGLANLKRLELVEAVIKEFTVSVQTYNMEKVTKGLNNELDKIKEEYELAVEIDANPELGSIFAGMLGIPQEELDNIPRTANQAMELMQKAIDKSFSELEEKNKKTADSIKEVQDAETKLLESFGKSDVIKAIEESFGKGNVNVIARPIVEATELVKKGWNDAVQDIAETPEKKTITVDIEQVGDLPEMEDKVLTVTAVYNGKDVAEGLNTIPHDKTVVVNGKIGDFEDIKQPKDVEIEVTTKVDATEYQNLVSELGESAVKIVNVDVEGDAVPEIKDETANYLVNIKTGGENIDKIKEILGDKTTNISVITTGGNIPTVKESETVTITYKADASEVQDVKNDLPDNTTITYDVVVNGVEDAKQQAKNIATVFSSSYGIIDKEGKVHEVLITPILPDGTVLSQDEMEKYIAESLDGADDILKADTKNIVIGVDVEGDAGEKLLKLHEELYNLPMENLAEIENLYGKVPKFDLSKMLNKSDFDKWVEENGHLIDDNLVKALENFLTSANKMQVNEGKDLRKNYEELLKKYDEYQNKLNSILIKASNERLTLIKKYGKKEQIDEGVKLVSRIAVEKDPEEKAKLIAELKKIVDDVSKDNNLAIRIKMAIDTQAARDTAKLAFEEFQKGGTWITATGNLSGLTNKALGTLITRLKEYKKEAKNLDPKEIKKINNALKSLYRQQREGNPFNVIGNAVDEAKDRFDNYEESIRKIEEEIKKFAADNGTGEYTEEQQKKLDSLIETWKKLREEQEESGKVSAKDIVSGIQSAINAVGQIVGTFNDLFDALSGNEWSEAKETVNDTFSVLQVAASYAAMGAQIGGGVGAAIGAVFGGVTSAITAFTDNSNKKIDNAIKRSERAVNRLSNSYRNLESAIDAAAGTAVMGLKQMAIANKEAQLAELKRQLQLEQSRSSKKRDEDKIESLRGQIIDLENDIKKASDEIVNDLLGISSVGDAADSLMGDFIEALRSGEDAMAGFGESIDEMIANMLKKLLVTKILMPKINEIFDEIQGRVDERTKDLSDERLTVEGQIRDIKDAYTELSNRGASISGYKKFSNTLTNTFGTEYVKKYFDEYEKTFRELTEETFEFSDFAEWITKRITEDLEKQSKSLKREIDSAWTEEDVKDSAVKLRDLKPTMENAKSNIQNLIDELDLMKDSAKDKNLSALQQGIMGITEDTAGALEAITNGISQQCYLQSDILIQIRDTVQSFDIDIQTASLSQILLQLQSSYQLQQSMLLTMENWTSPSGNAVRVELIS